MGDNDSVTSRLLALALTLIIGSPACWCCERSAPQPAKAKHACCEQSAPDESLPAAPDRKDPCPCGSSMIRREMAKSVVDVPPPNFASLFPPPVCEYATPALPMVTRAVPYFHDTGPPHERLPIFLRHHALLM